ncbi:MULTISPECIES: VOC family protein [unclassified Streptomyces]|uniref:VOC family protein n=1 Tax=unclassified Streptomyces TaxID=2593676 RepID=UPI001D048D84|nr:MULTISPECIES: VOC family protein [unclassified Streptomyces]
MSGALSMLTSFCPVICTSRMDESRLFYSRLFGLTATRTTPWYTALTRPGERHHELALLDHTHPALPEWFRTPLRAVRLTLTVDDDAEAWERLAAHGAVDGGDLRRAVVTDPNGVRIDVVAA